MLKGKVKSFITGVVLSAVVVGGLGVVFAKQATERIDAIYNNIKIVIDGAEYIPNDGLGNVDEPFIYNGRTYLPLRALANAFGKDVDWDGATATVYLGKKGQNQPDNYLHKLQYSDCIVPPIKPCQNHAA